MEHRNGIDGNHALVASVMVQTGLAARDQHARIVQANVTRDPALVRKAAEGHLDRPRQQGQPDRRSVRAAIGVDR